VRRQSVAAWWHAVQRLRPRGSAPCRGVLASSARRWEQQKWRSGGTRRPEGVTGTTTTLTL
jgi:hypothetical protein